MNIWRTSLCEQVYVCVQNGTQYFRKMFRSNEFYVATFFIFGTLFIREMEEPATTYTESKENKNENNEEKKNEKSNKYQQ